MLKINDKIPNFEILTDKGDFKVSNHLGKNIVVFFFLEQTLLAVQQNPLHLLIIKKSLKNLIVLLLGFLKII